MSKRVALYLRVSTEEQNLDGQEHELRELAGDRGLEVVAVYRDKISGAAGVKRPQLEQLRQDAQLRRFGAVLVWSISRLGRSTLEVLGLVKELDDRGVGLASLREPAIDTTTANGRFVLQVWSAIAELEREQNRERTKMGVAAARRKGKRIGRPAKILDPHQVSYVVQQNSVAFASRLFGVSEPTIRKALRAAALARAATNPPAGDPT